MALAIYRKYRPKVLADLLGQEHITEIIRNAARRKRLAHAYLFYGPRGTGKTTTARLIAKLANCETRAKDEGFLEKGEPCNQCRPCLEIDAGRGLDVIEIDAASNRGIDEMRSLKEGIAFSPTSYPYKVFIIDEAHQLTKDAANALLKTLEEPPPHAILILATTEYEKVPATIVSRTQKFHFRRLPIKHIIAKLESIVRAENLNVTEDAIELIAATAEGSLRDAESLLDQLTSLKEKVTAEAVETTIGKVSSRRTAELAELLIKGDLAASLRYVADVFREGHNVVDFTKELIHYFRRGLTLRLNPSLETLFAEEMTHEALDVLKNHSRALSEERTIALLKSLIRAYSEMRYSPFATIPLEVALIENLDRRVIY